jgi:O-antigen ligase
VPLGAAAGALALGRDLPAALGLAGICAGAAALWTLLRRPIVWIPLFLILAVLTPPWPVGEAPVHPASLVFAAALPAMLARGLSWGRDRLSWMMLLFLGVLLFSTALAFAYSGVTIGAQSLLRWLLLSQAFVLFAWIAYGPRGGAPEAEALVRLLLWLGLAGAALGAADFVFQIPPTVRFSEQYIHLPDGPRRRAQGFFYDASVLGLFCAFQLLLIASLALRRERLIRGLRWLPWVAAPLLMFALVVSFSRGAVLNLIAGAAVLMFCHRRALFERRAVAYAAAAAAIATVSTAVALVWAPAIVRIFLLRLQFSALQFFASPNEVLSSRLTTWSYLLDFVVAHPEHFLLGIGYKTLPYTSFLGRPLVADNMYGSLLVECGALGLFVFLALCAAILRAAWQFSRSADPLLAALGAFLLAAWCGFMMQMLSGDTLTYWRVTPVYFVLLGAAFRRYRSLRRGRGPL